MRNRFMLVFFIWFLLIAALSFFLSTERWLLIPFILLCILAPLSMIWMVKKTEGNADELLQKGGLCTTAQILKVEDTGLTMNRVNIGVRLTLQVSCIDGTSFPAVTELFVSRVNIPRAGDTVEVIYNPLNKKEIAVVRE